MLTPAALRKLRGYVDDGGYLFTEDWCLKEIHSVIFKDYITLGMYLAKMEVSILPKPGALTHPYLRKIFAKPPKTVPGGTTTESEFEKISQFWMIDDESPAIKITGQDRVSVLIYSNDVGEASVKDGSDAVAVTFVINPKGPSAARDPVATGASIEQDRTKMSGGRVLHVLSHFGRQKSLDDEFTLQNLLLNFLIEASERRGYKLRQQDQPKK